MDSDTLLTASKYVNNLLITRGLLRNGKEIRFEKPDRDTRAHTINLVHDLLLRRDKDHELREQSAATIHAMRIDLARRDGEIRKLREELTTKDRSIHQTRTESWNATAETRRLDQGTKALQDQIHKLKATMTHVKNQCAADLKKRDIQMERLRSHLQGQQRGNRTQVIAPSMTISGGSGVTMNSVAPSLNASVRELDDPEYSLKQESNDFLTRLSASLSDENDGLINLLQTSLDDLRQLLSLEGQAADDAAGVDEPPLHNLGTLSAEMKVIRDALRQLLTSPSFVAVEEVEARDEEIARLRDGWDMMEGRWQDVLGMMDGWKRKMERSGDTINLTDLQQGLGLGADLEAIAPALSPARRRRISEHGKSSGNDESRPPSKDSAISGLADNEHGTDRRRTGKTPSSVPSRSNVSAKSTRSTRVLHQTPSPLESSSMITRSARSAMMQDEDKENRANLDTDLSDALLQLPRPSPQKRASKSNIPSSLETVETTPSMAELSIMDKLKVAQIEADDALKGTSAPTVGTPQSDQHGLDKANDSLMMLRSTKKSTDKPRPKKRKSTLSPEELDSLLGF